MSFKRPNDPQNPFSGKIGRFMSHPSRMEKIGISTKAHQIDCCKEKTVSAVDIVVAVMVVVIAADDDDSGEDVLPLNARLRAP